MRTKTLVLAAAFGAVSVATSMAQVFSENAVGYYVRDLPAGFTMIANQLNNGDNTLNTVIPLDDSFIGTEYLTWNVDNQAFNNPDTFFGASFGGWVDGDFAVTDTTIVPGGGGFINLNQPGSLTFVGEVPQGTLTVDIAPNFSIISQPTPQELGVFASGLDGSVANVGDEILFWNGTAFDNPLTYFGTGFDWVDGDFATVDPTPVVGESFFYNNPGGTPLAWTREFSVNN